MSDRNFLFVRMGFMYTSRLMMIYRELLRSSGLYEGLMETVAEVGIVVGTCDRMSE